MKKWNKTLIIFLSLLAFSACNRGECWQQYYRLKNDLGQDIMLKIYRTNGSTGDSGYDTVLIENGEYSELYEKYECPPAGEDYYIATSDSIEVFIDGVFVKYYGKKKEEDFLIKSPYNLDSYEIVQDEKYGEINVYTFLPEDFE